MSSQEPPLLSVNELVRYFDVSKPLLNRLIERSGHTIVKAVDGVSFEIKRGETFSLVGESGCGKSTVARLVVGLYQPTAGQMEFDGASLHDISNRSSIPKVQARMQMIFQDPYASLNPRWRVSDIVAEPVIARKLISDSNQIKERVGELLGQVGLSPMDAEKYPMSSQGASVSASLLLAPWPAPRNF